VVLLSIGVWFLSWPFERFIAKQRDEVFPVAIIESEIYP